MKNFQQLISSIEQTHRHIQARAVYAVNQALTIRNWLIGYYIVEFEQNVEDRAKYGTNLLSNLAQKLKHIKGLDERSFRNFRLLYNHYPQMRPVIAQKIENNTDWPSATPRLLNLPNNIRGSVTTESKMDSKSMNGNILLSKLAYTHLIQYVVETNWIKSLEINMMEYMGSASPQLGQELLVSPEKIVSIMNSKDSDSRE